MQPLQLFRSSIVIKLIMMNLLVLLAGAGVVIVNLVLSRQVGDTLNTVIDKDVYRVIDNAELSRDINTVFAETHLLISTFTEREDLLETEGRHLVDTLQASIALHETGGIHETLTRFTQALETLLGQCERILQEFRDIQVIGNQLDSAITALDEVVTDIIITRKTEDKEYELFAVKQVSASIPDYRSLLLQIAMQIDKARRDHVGTATVKEAYEQETLALLEELNSGLLIVTTAGEELELPGQQLLTTVQQYREHISKLHQTMRIFRTQLSDMNNAQMQVMTAMAAIETEVAQATGHIRETVNKDIHSSRNVTAIFSVIIIIVLGGTGIYAISITRPILHLTASATAMASGNLDAPVDISGTDEIGKLARSFVHMRTAIREKIDALAKKNVELHQEILERKRIEGALRESEERFRSIFLQSPIGIELYDKEGLLIDVNTICLEMFGVKDLDLVKGFKLFEDPNLSENAKRRLLQGESVRYEMMFDFDLVKARDLYETTKSGQHILECFITQWGAGPDNIQGFLVHVMDITERKQAEETLRESKERYRQLFELESDAIFLIDNETGRILEANSAASALYGYDHEELLTKKNVDLSAEPEDTHRVTQTTSPTSDQVVTIPLRLHRKRDGTIFPVEITGRFFVRQGRPFHIAAIRDITERKQAEEALRESAEQYRIITNTAMDGFAAVDLEEGRLLDVNMTYCHMTGYSRDELLKMSIQDIEAMERPDDTRRHIQKLIEVGSDRFETRHRRKDGRIIDVEVSITFICQSGQLLAFLRDITERKRAEKQLKNQNLLLEQAVQEKQQEMETLFERLLRQEKLATIGQMASSIAHELRNPLGAIKQSIFFLKRLYHREQLDASNPKVEEHLILIENELDISERVISDLLQMTRIKSLHRERIDLRSIIADLVKHCCLPERIHLVLDVSPEPFFIWADPVQLRQVFINLLTNAVQAIEQEGRITISAKQLTGESTSVIEVEDTGTGIESDLLDNAFEPLYTTKATGTGLGLSICKQIIENHHGHISMRSEKGQGTTVTIVLPDQE